MEEKTILEWFEQAKADGYEWAEAAIKNCKGRAHILNQKVSLLSEALIMSPTFTLSPEGEDFWFAIRDSLMEKGL